MRVRKVIGKRGEVKSFWSVMTKRPKLEGSEKWRVKFSKVQ